MLFFYNLSNSEVLTNVLPYSKPFSFEILDTISYQSPRGLLFFLNIKGKVADIHHKFPLQSVAGNMKSSKERTEKQQSCFRKYAKKNPQPNQRKLYC